MKYLFISIFILEIILQMEVHRMSKQLPSTNVTPIEGTSNTNITPMLNT